MNPNVYVRLESNFDFKRSYYNKTFWWKNILMLPPVLLLFTGLVGILYLFNYDKLVSFYVIPYILLFMAGTIWFKAIKKHIQKTALTASDSFNICVAKPVGEKEGFTYFVFSTKEKRHNDYYLSKLLEDINVDELLSNKKARKESVLISEGNEFPDLYLKAFASGNIVKKNKSWKSDGFLPLLYITAKDTFIVKKRDLQG